MCGSSPARKKNVEVRRWDEKNGGSATRGVEGRFRLNQQVKRRERERERMSGYCKVRHSYTATSPRNPLVADEWMKVK